MRIISGKAKGLKLKAPVSAVVRPTEDRVKETLFSSLGTLNGAIVLDLFSGTGSLGLEAMSRGAADVYMFERDAKQVENIRDNIADFCRLVPEAAKHLHLFQADVSTLADFLPKTVRNAIDIILADPPYNPAEGQFGGKDLLTLPVLTEFAAEDCLLVLEHETGSMLPWAPYSQWKVTRQKSFGIRTLSFAECL